mmetsp:Transcript_13733/g.41496  ORF Transcript_13733/g.41496 Transcript_13733/m.41496 type:complete len:290 (+) Transcript_13733:178-1047(+)
MHQAAQALVESHEHAQSGGPGDCAMGTSSYNRILQLQQGRQLGGDQGLFQGGPAPASGGVHVQHPRRGSGPHSPLGRPLAAPRVRHVLQGYPSLDARCKREHCSLLINCSDRSGHLLPSRQLIVGHEGLLHHGGLEADDCHAIQGAAANDTCCGSLSYLKHFADLVDVGVGESRDVGECRHGWGGATRGGQVQHQSQAGIHPLHHRALKHLANRWEVRSDGEIEQVRLQRQGGGLGGGVHCKQARFQMLPRRIRCQVLAQMEGVDGAGEVGQERHQQPVRQHSLYACIH